MKDYSFLYDPVFTKARADGDYHFFGNLDLELFTWEDVVEELNRSVVARSDIRTFKNLGFTLHEAENILHVKEFNDEYSKLDTSMYSTAHCYVSFLEVSGSIGRHKDDVDVIFWQVIGKTHWKVESLTGIKEHILEPNHAIYVPRRMWHTVIPLTPRAGVSFGLK